MQETPVRFLVGKIPWRRDKLPIPVFSGFPGGSDGKESTCNAGDLGLTPELGRSPGEGSGYPLQYSGLENSMTEELHSLQSMGSQRVRHYWVTFTFTLLLCILDSTIWAVTTKQWLCPKFDCFLAANEKHQVLILYRFWKHSSFSGRFCVLDSVLTYFVYFSDLSSAMNPLSPIP